MSSWYSRFSGSNSALFESRVRTSFNPDDGPILHHHNFNPLPHLDRQPLRLAHQSRDGVSRWSLRLLRFLLLPLADLP